MVPPVAWHRKASLYVLEAMLPKVDDHSWDAKVRKTHSGKSESSVVHLS